MNRGGIADLTLLRTLLAICLEFREPIAWEVRDSFVFAAYASPPASRTLLQQLLACLNLTLDSEDLFCCYKKIVIPMNHGSSKNAENYGDE